MIFQGEVVFSDDEDFLEMKKVQFPSWLNNIPPFLSMKDQFRFTKFAIQP